MNVFYSGLINLQFFLHHLTIKLTIMIFNSIVNKISQKTNSTVLLLLLTGSSAFAQFSGPFAPGNWTLTNVNADGSVNTAGAPANIAVIGGNNGSNLSGYTEYSITAPSHGIVTATWEYNTADSDGPAFDPAFYNANGVLTQLSNSAGPNNQSGTLAFSVLEGQTFGFRVGTFDNLFGRARLVISNFVFTDISCGNNGDKIQICHKPGAHNAKTLCIGLDGLADHLGHGDYVGPCGSPVTASPLTAPRDGDNNLFTQPGRQRLNVIVQANPTQSYFTLKLNGDASQEISLKMTDATGRQIELKQNLLAGQTLQVGQNYAPGVYIAEITQGNNRRTIKLLKIE